MYADSPPAKRAFLFTSIFKAFVVLALDADQSVVRAMTAIHDMTYD